MKFETKEEKLTRLNFELAAAYLEKAGLTLKVVYATMDHKDTSELETELAIANHNIEFLKADFVEAGGTLPA